MNDCILLVIKVIGVKTETKTKVCSSYNNIYPTLFYRIMIGLKDMPYKVGDHRWIKFEMWWTLYILSKQPKSG